MEELFDNFKALFSHMQEEKQLLEADNLRSRQENH
jgi:hypothetical protein